MSQLNKGRSLVLIKQVFNSSDELHLNALVVDSVFAFKHFDTNLALDVITILPCYNQFKRHLTYQVDWSLVRLTRPVSESGHLPAFDAVEHDVDVAGRREAEKRGLRVRGKLPAY